MDNWMKQSNAITTYSLLDAVVGSLVRASQASYTRYEQTETSLTSKDIKKSTESAEFSRFSTAIWKRVNDLRKGLNKPNSMTFLRVVEINVLDERLPSFC